MEEIVRGGQVSIPRGDFQLKHGIFRKEPKKIQCKTPWIGIVSPRLLSYHMTNRCDVDGEKKKAPVVSPQVYTESYAGRVTN